MDRLVPKEAVQVVGQFLGRGVTVGRILAEGLQNDEFQFAGNSAVNRPRRPRIAVQHVSQEGGACPARENGPEGQQFVEGGRQRVDVRAMVQNDPLPRGLFGAHVADRAENVAGLGQPGSIMKMGQPEVRDPHVPSEINQQVRRLDVTMNDAFPMRIFQGFGGLGHAPGDRAVQFRLLAGMVGGKMDRKLRLRRAGLVNARCPGDRQRIVGRRRRPISGRADRTGG